MKNAEKIVEMALSTVYKEIDIISYSKVNGIKYTPDEFLLALTKIREVLENGKFHVSQRKYLSERFQKM